MTSQVVVDSTNWTVGKVYDSFPEAAARWEALGQQDSDIHWAYGREADALIQLSIPAMLVYSAIGKKAGKSSQTIRKSYYTFKTFTDAQREQYCLAPYSVFQHARTWDNPEEVLQYHADEGCSVDEIEEVFKSTEPEERELFKQSGFDRYLVGAWRKMIGLSREKRSQAEYHLKAFQELVK